MRWNIRHTILIRMLCIGLTATPWMALPLLAQDKGVVQAENATYQSGLAEITEGRVTSTISFLASDELAGRATGSAEFNIAAAFIASRFRGAGLEGGASDGGFYHETPTSLIQTPSGPVTFNDAESNAIAQFSLLAAGPEALDYRGKLHAIDLTKELPTSGLEGVVGGRFAPTAKGQRLSAQVARMATTLHAAGAKALILAVAPDSELLTMAMEMKAKPRNESPRSRNPIPVLLVPESGLSVESIQLQIPATIVKNFPMRNVIGVIRGTDPELSKEAVLFSAHLDHLGAKPGVGDGIFNGADDDATGVTAVVLLADAFSRMPKPKRSILFMTFWGEESGLLGSKQFVATPSWPLEKIAANINIEMIGRPEPGSGGKVWVTGWGESNLGPLMRDAAQSFGVEIFEHPKFSAQLYRQSDNWSFAEKGVIAHSFSAGSLHADYHQPDDEWERLEIPHMTRVIQGLFVGSLPFANGEVTPTKVKK